MGTTKKDENDDDNMELRRRDKLKITSIQFGVAFFLASLIAALGSLTYIILHNSELSTFKAQFRSVGFSVTRSIFQGLERKIAAATLVSQICSIADQNGMGGKFPNFTLPGFEEIMTNVNSLSGVRFSTVNPLVTQENRLSWEQYAQQNVALLKPGSPSIWAALNNSAEFGIYTVVDGKKVAAPAIDYKRIFPTVSFPTWSVAPIESSFTTVFYDPYSDQVNDRIETLNTVFTDRVSKLTDIVELVVDKNEFVPSTIIYAPIEGRGEGKPLIGLFAGGFSCEL